MAGSLVYQAEGLRVRHSYLDAGKEIPWHRHSQVADVVFALKGTLVVETQHPEQRVTLQPGEAFRANPGQPHRVSNPTDARVEFMLLQGVGAYDFQPLDRDPEKLKNVSL